MRLACQVKTQLNPEPVSFALLKPFPFSYLTNSWLAKPFQSTFSLQITFLLIKSFSSSLDPCTEEVFPDLVLRGMSGPSPYVYYFVYTTDRKLVPGPNTSMLK
jgi:hypothetical protein